MHAQGSSCYITGDIEGRFRPFLFITLYNNYTLVIDWLLKPDKTPHDELYACTLCLSPLLQVVRGQRPQHLLAQLCPGHQACMQVLVRLVAAWQGPQHASSQRCGVWEEGDSRSFAPCTLAVLATQSAMHITLAVFQCDCSCHQQSLKHMPEHWWVLFLIQHSTHAA